MNKREMSANKRPELKVHQTLQCANLLANAFLKELFRTIPEDKIQEILDANDGDVDATTEELVRQVDLFAAQSEKERHEKERNRNTEMLVIKFGFSPEDTRTVLSKHNWNLQEAVKDLVKRDTERRLQEFFALFPVSPHRDNPSQFRL